MKNTAQITHSGQAAILLKACISTLDHEELWCLFLNQDNRLISIEMVTKGSLDSTIIDARTILRRSLLNNASKVLVAHNHPSGNPMPSHQDIEQTRKIRTVCDVLDIPLVDHIVLAKDNYFSFADETIQNYQPLNV